MSTEGDWLYAPQEGELKERELTDALNNSHFEDETAEAEPLLHLLYRFVGPGCVVRRNRNRRRRRCRLRHETKAGDAGQWEDYLVVRVVEEKTDGRRRAEAETELRPMERNQRKSFGRSSWAMEVVHVSIGRSWVVSLC